MYEKSISQLQSNHRYDAKDKLIILSFLFYFTDIDLYIFPHCCATDPICMVM